MKCEGEHKRPVHFNRGHHGHIWICLACAKQLAGPKLLDEEREALYIFAHHLNRSNEQRSEHMSNLNYISVKVAGANRVDLVKNLRAFADNLDGNPAGKKGRVVDTDDDAEISEKAVAEDDEELVPRRGKKAAAAAAFDDEEAEQETEDAAEEEVYEAEEPPPKKTKLDLKAVNDACKVHAKKHGFDTTRALLQKKFKVSTVSKLKPEQFAAVISTMKV